ncbi:CRISPR-associated helicase Cas3 [Magnetospirillum sp. UT-4]|nr:CRISPR-associated helicase Cas3 [Magnetospirillum sp. UT-4]
MIRTVLDEDAHLEEARRRVDHSSAGALHAVKALGDTGLALAFVIAGHHAGLPDFQGEDSRKGLKDRLGDADLLLGAAMAAAPADLLAPPPLKRPPERDPSLWIRMLASAVFEADFLDTEAFFDPGRSGARSGWADMGTLRPRLDQRLSRFAGASGPVNQVRATVLAAARDAAKGQPGLYALTVPTGGGKTLASLAFALDHVHHHPDRLRRVIYAVPFTSIIEQTAAVFRETLGDDAVLEHHSALDEGSREESNRNRLAAETWDAPVVVTTTVQLFESLFASRTSRLRKLHNIAGSVVVLDEAQALPPDLLLPITAALAELVEGYGVTVVLCTATQPALGAVFKELPRPIEIAPDPPALFAALDRVRVSFPQPGERQSWEAIAAAMTAEDRALAIVNSRADCRTLHGLLPAGAIHLSTWQCAAHRARLLARLKEGGPARVVSTSLVEAGVDIDFPAVWRAMAGLDAIAQAAGRCNREGLLPDKGRMVVFRPEGGRLHGHLAQAAEAAEAALRKHPEAPFHPEAFITYFNELYWSKRSLDPHGIGRMLGLGEKRPGRPWYDIAFRTAADAFRMIDQREEPLVVLFDQRAEAAVEELRRDGPSRATLRALQRYTVPVRPKALAQLRETGAAEDIGTVTVLVRDELYDREGVGLMLATGD